MNVLRFIAGVLSDAEEFECRVRALVLPGDADRAVSVANRIVSARALRTAATVGGVRHELLRLLAEGVAIDRLEAVL